MDSLESILAFLLAHSDLITALYVALSGGADKSKIMEAIKQSMVAASDAEMQNELG